MFRITATCEKFAIIYRNFIILLQWKGAREWNTNTNWLAVWHKIIIIMHSSSSSSSSKLHEKKSVPIWCSACIRARRPAQCKISWCLFFRKIFPCPTKRLGMHLFSLIFWEILPTAYMLLLIFYCYGQWCVNHLISFFFSRSSFSIALILILKITPQATIIHDVLTIACRQ